MVNQYMVSHFMGTILQHGPFETMQKKFRCLKDVFVKAGEMHNFYSKIWNIKTEGWQNLCFSF